MTTETTKGVWKRDPRGVDYVTFTIPEVEPSKPKNQEATFQFDTPREKQPCYVRIKNVDELLGVIVLFKPEKMV